MVPLLCIVSSSFTWEDRLHRYKECAEYSLFEYRAVNLTISLSYVVTLQQIAISYFYTLL